ncbi:MAG TPA: ATP synthase F1 subunit delta [Candidatus Avimonas sp.]|nr:ATP synthase F1 subunit delta [Candidatus Avimonas sp.]
MARIEKSYANALYELSAEKDSLEKDLEQAVSIKKALNSPDTLPTLVSSKVPNTEKFKLLDKVIEEGTSEHIWNFLRMMVEKRREEIILPVLTEYIELLNRGLSRIEAKVVSAKELTVAQKEAVRRLLSKKINRQFYISYSVDPDILGGFYIMVGGRIFDCTVRTELLRLRERLKRGNFE